VSPGSAAPRLSVCVITFQEEDRLPDCLASVSFADEIVVVDSNSSDRTGEIAERAGARVIRRAFPGYVEQVNFAAEQARGAWVLALDADERLSPELAREIREVVAREDAGGEVAVAYEMPRCAWYLGRWIRHGAWYPDRKLRLWRRGRARWEGRNPHDHAYADGPTERLQGDLLHLSYRDVSDHLRTIDRFTTIMADARHAEGERFRWHQLLLSPPLRFARDFLWKRGFLDGAAGFLIAVLASYYVFLRHLKLWELQRASASPPRDVPEAKEAADVRHPE